MVLAPPGTVKSQLTLVLEGCTAGSNPRRIGSPTNSQ